MGIREGGGQFCTKGTIRMWSECAAGSRSLFWPNGSDHGVPGCPDGPGPSGVDRPGPSLPSFGSTACGRLAYGRSGNRPCIAAAQQRHQVAVTLAGTSLGDLGVQLLVVGGSVDVPEDPDGGDASRAAGEP